MLTLTRSSLFSVLVMTASVAFAGGALASTALFKDVPANHWAAAAIASVKEAGLMNGANDNFRPNDGVTRAELAVVADRLLQKINGGGDTYVPPSEADGTPAKVDDDMSLGSTDAPVTIIEFSDFQCPFCGRFAEQTFPSIKSDYIDTNKVRFVFRDMPLSFHSAAYPAAVAVECAHSQSNSLAWKLHDKIFANQDTLTIDTDETLKTWAHALAGLNDTKFDTCYDDMTPSDEIDSDIADAAAAGISGTPGFWILGPNGQSKKISGAYPYSEFQAAIDAFLN